MEDHDRRDRFDRDSDTYENDPDYYGAQSADAAPGNAGYARDPRRTESGRYARESQQRRPVGVFYEEYLIRAPRRDRVRGPEARYAREREERYASDAFAPRGDRFGQPRYDESTDYFTSESQVGRDFSGGAARGGGYSGYAGGVSSRALYGHDRDDQGYSTARYSDRPRGRDWWDRTTDEVASWFGDEKAAQRRQMDHRGRGPSDYTRSDERIREDINDHLTDDWAVDARKVRVKVENGEVTLDGTVPTRLQKRRAEDCAEEVSGVGHVQNNLRIDEAPSWSDNEATKSAPVSGKPNV